MKKFLTDTLLSATPLLLVALGMFIQNIIVSLTFIIVAIVLHIIIRRITASKIDELSELLNLADLLLKKAAKNKARGHMHDSTKS